MRPVDIREIDMHLRDERVLNWIMDRATVDGTMRPVQIRSDDIAAEFSCHVNTARAILKRLIGAQLISIERNCKTSGYVYRVIETAGAA